MIFSFLGTQEEIDGGEGSRQTTNQDDNTMNQFRDNWRNWL